MTKPLSTPRLSQSLACSMSPSVLRSIASSSAMRSLLGVRSRRGWCLETIARGGRDIQVAPCMGPFVWILDGSTVLVTAVQGRVLRGCSAFCAWCARSLQMVHPDGFSPCLWGGWWCGCWRFSSAGRCCRCVSWACRCSMPGAGPCEDLPYSVVARMLVACIG